MKVAIAGAGISGAYLAFQLSLDHEVEVYEKRTPETLGEDCAWGTSKRMVEKYSSILDRDASNYLRHIGRKFISAVSNNRDTVTFNKNKFIRDFLEKSEAEIHYEQKAKRENLEKFNLAIDATGPDRALLPTPEDKPSKNWICPCFQVDVRSTELPRDFYFDIKEAGYLWVFPQGDNKAKVGCGDFVLNPKEEVEGYLSGKNLEVTNEMGAKIRMIPPSKSKPFFVDGSPPVLGVGEAIGTVSPISGEGNLPSLICANLLLESLQKKENPQDVAKIYEPRVLEEFTWADKWFNFINSVRFGNKISQLWHLARGSVPDYCSGDVSKLNMALQGF